MMAIYDPRDDDRLDRPESVAQQAIRFQDSDYIYEIGAFDDYLICIPLRDELYQDEEYIEIHMNDLSEYERKIFDFLTEMTEQEIVSSR
jgi:hypothetical protein